MADYSHYKIETLEKMRNAAWNKYYIETNKASDNWGDGMRLAKLPQHKAWERAKERYETICAEIKRREAESKDNRHVALSASSHDSEPANN